jgi:Fuc2NAc and GlcNAc transferase
MMSEKLLVTGAVAAVCFVISVVGTAALRRFAVRSGLIDVPNERSSHTIPTPRSGGLAIVVASLLGMTALFALGTLSRDLYVALAVGGTAVALVGFIDDRMQLSARVRLLVHLAAAGWALFCLGGLDHVRIAGEPAALGPVGYLVGILGIVWTINLFNFMDGIDGIAGSEAAFISWSLAGIASFYGLSGGSAAAGVIFGAACCGFLAWNWPPARIFMGDVGSGYLGYVVAVLSVAAARHAPITLAACLILGGVFFVDATTTLLRRVLRRERAFQAHREHAYQVLARKSSHRTVTVGVLALNAFWSLPAAWLATCYPERAGWIVLGALGPLVALAILVGAGRREPSA